MENTKDFEKQEFLNAPHTVQMLCTLLEAEYKTNVLSIFQNLTDWLGEGEEVSSGDYSRHWTDIEKIIKVGERIYKYDWAKTSDDYSIWDKGFFRLFYA